MENSTLVCRGSSPVKSCTSSSSSVVFVSTSGSQTDTPSQESEVGRMASVRGSFRRAGISEWVTDFLSKAWDEKTFMAYWSDIKA
ncbi:hypothetical protein E2C01_060048 [Portunus trituberculatus]|uniref:Uncharacterized protein n=1 Tax=Portunus trituberculatus TaxID=210409 RepID=A0A5B7H166_PORTR|nr:hypothetical protein [Portunus trituberculatus]